MHNPTFYYYIIGVLLGFLLGMAYKDFMRENERISNYKNVLPTRKIIKL